jgi:hypothetical protein
VQGRFGSDDFVRGLREDSGTGVWEGGISSAPFALLAVLHKAMMHGLPCSVVPRRPLHTLAPASLSRPRHRRLHHPQQRLPP